MKKTARALTVYHNPRCSKSRQVLALLEERGYRPDIVEYLKTPPSQEQLRQILARLGMGPRDLMRKGEAPYKELNLADKTLSDDRLIALMVAHPVLIERPVVVCGESAALGRPPENVLAVLPEPPV